MTSLNGIAPNMFYGRPPQPIKQPSYKEDEITALKAQESNYETQITQLQGSNNEDSQAKVQSLQSDLATVEEKLDNLKPISMVKPHDAPPPPPHRAVPTDEEMNARFGAAYSVEISSLKMTDRE
ncbi:hypothetical protein SAMN05216582_11856 [Selenomonas ruminantium]|uniref:Uncharacterized protein n=1 Tax=Selenomonas ruminantium TaxID=971 RepID=A0A1M6VGD9_SELRU|nr:hypothetical protein [Selenomonas ruminantium]SHK80573.1 hypothetical protein SAMN05216582_11856 [Selenomonas ruminantium]